MVAARRRRRRLWAHIAALATATVASPANAACSPPSQVAAGATRGVNASDIIEMREVGYPDGSLTGPSPFAVSPDATRVAFVMTKANVASNRYCRSLVIVPLKGGLPAVIETGGEFISLGTFVRGLWVDTGFPQLVTPVWSPNGNSVAVLQRVDGITQVMIIDAGNRDRKVLSRLPANAEDVWWDRSGRLFVAMRPTGKAALAVDREGLSGWLYDARIAPNYGARPRLRATDAPRQVVQVDIGDGSFRPARTGTAERPTDSAQKLRAASNGRIWLEPLGPSPFAPRQIWGVLPSGKKIACSAEACRGRFVGLWWDAQRAEVRFLRREGWNAESSALYRWTPGDDAPRPILRTTDVVQNCAPAAANLVCTVENSRSPPRVVLLDPVSGRTRLLFDPNPEIARLRLGTVRRLRFRSDRGLEAWADLVLPSTYQEGTKLPMILVQYNSRGFLRGGTGNEYPIFALAEHGFAVLSLERPRAVASADPTLRTDEELNAANEKGWAERKSMLSATLAAIDAAIATGSIDGNALGLTGLSDGATSVRFALINSGRFRAAAISSCCLEPKTVMTYGGIAWADFNRAVGYPLATDDAPEFWRPMSLSRNAGHLRTPLLMQLADDEYLLSLEAFQALREKQAPVEMYVFPDEHHVKWQPLHKLAVFNRTVDWFSYWLRCRRDPDVSKHAQYRRWDDMRSNSAEPLACPSVMTRPPPTPPRRQGA